MSSDAEVWEREYFNMLCGHIVTALYKATRVAARFSVPSFHWGNYSPENHKEQFVFRYSSGWNETVELVHHIPASQAGNNGATIQ